MSSTGHRLSEQACPDGEHELEPVPTTVFAERCATCGLSSQTLTDDLGHEGR
jgi:hypothetical protein